jgi:methionine-rich copper-binding protein CopC
VTKINIQQFSLQLLVMSMFLFFGPGQGWAHSKQEMTIPANNAILTEAPAELVLKFDKPMRITKLALTDQAGADYKVQRTDQMKHVLKLVAQLDPVPNGEYKVDWRGLSEDGHPMKGTFSFTVK